MTTTGNRIHGIALVSEQRQPVKSLRGFLKAHKVPSEVSERTKTFVERIAAQDISDDLDQRFEEFREHFRFKRIDLRVADPANGSGGIITPWFEYRMTVTHAPDDAHEAVLRRQVSDFQDPESLLSAQFAAVFGRLFDTVEFEPAEPIQVDEVIDRFEASEESEIEIDYDRATTWCELTAERLPGRFIIRSDRVALITRQPQLPAQLLEAWLQFRARLKGIECF